MRTLRIPTVGRCLFAAGIVAICVAAPAQARQATSSQQTGAAQAQPAEQPAPPTIDPRFESPRAAIMSFLDAAKTLSSEDSTPEARADADDRLALVFGRDAAQIDFVRDSAGRLVEILNRLGEVRELDFPDAQRAADQGMVLFKVFPFEGGNPRRSWRRQENNLLEAFPNGLIELTRDEVGHWRFSESTLGSLDAFHTAIRDVSTVFEGEVDTAKLSAAIGIERLLPQVLIVNQPLGVKLWKWFGLLLFILLGVIFDFIIRSVLRVSWKRLAKKRGGDVEDATLARAVRPFGLVVSSLIVLVGVRLLGLPEMAQLVLLTAARFVLTVAMVTAAYRLADLLAEFFSRKAELSETRIDDLLVPLLRKTAKIFIAAMGVVYLANALSIEIVPLLTGLGIGGLAVAFAAKDTIENFFGSVAVIVDRPFDVGDWIVIGDVEGTVETMGLRSTRVRTFYNSLVTVPNASLVRTNVDNYGRRRYRRFRTYVSIAYDTPADTIEAFCEGIRELVRQHPYTRKDYYQIWLHEMSASSLDVLVYVFHEAPDWSTELRERQRLLLDIIRLAKQMHIEFAFPTQTLYMREEKWTAPSDPSGIERESAALNAGRNAVSNLMGQKEWRKKKPGAYEFFGAKPVSTGDAEGGEGSQVEDRTAGA